MTSKEYCEGKMDLIVMEHEGNDLQSINTHYIVIVQC